MQHRHALPVDIPVKRTEVTRLSDVEPTDIQWLFPGRIALGKLSLISGDPGLGKSLVTLDMASIVSRGGVWPDGTRSPPGDVLLLSAEDAINDTIRPRLDACHGNPERVHAINMVSEPDVDGQMRKRGFSIRSDVDELDRLLNENKAIRLVVVDPISAYLGDVDSHNNAEVRSLLTPLADLAEQHSVAIVAVTHLNKGGSKAIYRQSGSIAFVAAARASYAVCKDQDDPDRRLFVPVKNNLGDDRTGFAYRVITAENDSPRIEWEPDLVTVDDLDDMVSTSPGESGSALSEAKNFLGDFLVDGPKPANEALKAARQAAHSEATIRRAKDALQIRSIKQRRSGQWVWELPEQHAQQTSVPNVEHLEYLGQQPPEELI